MIVSAWSKASDLGTGELWVYPEIDDEGASATLRVVSEGRVIDWTLTPDEADMLMAMLKKVADRHTHMEPVSEPMAATSPEEESEPIGEVFVRQEAQQTAPGASIGEKLGGVLDRFRA